MTFFNKKFDVLGIELSPYGKHLLQNGKLMPKYYAFFDDDVIYDSSAAGFTERNSDIRDRILNETPVLRPHYMFKTVEDLVNKDQPFPVNQHDNVKRPIADETAKFLQYSLGSSDPTKQNAPAWNLVTLATPISASNIQLSSSQYQPLNIAQVNFDIDYELSIRNKDDDAPVVGTKGTPNLPLSDVMDDGTYLNLEEEQVLVYLLEENGFLFGESLELEVFMFETTGSGDSLRFTEELRPLKFIKRDKQVLNDVMIRDTPDAYSFRDDGTAITPQHVEYYFDCRVDQEIPLGDLCKGMAALKAAGVGLDNLLDIECPDDIDGGSIYTSKVSDLEDCD